MKGIVGAGLLAAVCLQAIAGPAPWYRWRSKVENVVACAQTTLGPGWERTTGPYKDSRCEKPALVK